MYTRSAFAPAWAVPLCLLTLSWSESAPDDAGTYPGSGPGYRAVAEFEPTDAVIIAWDDDYADVLSDLIRALRWPVTAIVLVPDPATWLSAAEYLEDIGLDRGSVHFIDQDFDSIWTRDFGPISARRTDGGFVLVDNEYYSDRVLDDQVPAALAEHLEIPVVESGLTLEGGNFMANGEGLCVTTEQIEDDNPDLNADDIARRLLWYLGCEDLVVLNRLAVEPTGHVDMFAKFTAPDTVLVGRYSREFDPENAEILDRNAEFLEGTRLPDGRPITVVRVPMASNHDGIFRSYLNSLYVNGTVIIPTCDTERDLEQDVFAAYRLALPPLTELVALDASDLTMHGGAVHCITQGISYRPDSRNRLATNLMLDYSVLNLPGRGPTGPAGSSDLGVWLGLLNASGSLDPSASPWALPLLGDRGPSSRRM